MSELGLYCRHAISLKTRVRNTWLNLHASTVDSHGKYNFCDTLYVCDDDNFLETCACVCVYLCIYLQMQGE